MGLSGGREGGGRGVRDGNWELAAGVVDLGIRGLDGNCDGNCESRVRGFEGGRAKGREDRKSVV